MCACEFDKRCMYHAEMLDRYQAMWKLLRDIAKGETLAPDAEAEKLLTTTRYLHL